MWRMSHQGHLQLVGIFCGASNALQLLNGETPRAHRFFVGETAGPAVEEAPQRENLQGEGVLAAKPPAVHTRQAVDTYGGSYFFYQKDYTTESEPIACIFTPTLDSNGSAAPVYDAIDTEIEVPGNELFFRNYQLVIPPPRFV
jgi:hypothetical protein